MAPPSPYSTLKLAKTRRKCIQLYNNDHMLIAYNTKYIFKLSIILVHDGIVPD